MPRVSFLTIVNYLEQLAANHTEINGSYRWNSSEFSGSLRKGVALPVMLIDAVETQTSGDHKKTIHSNMTAFTILGKPNIKTGNMDTYAAQNEVLDFCQQLCFDIETRIIHDAEQVSDAEGNQNWLYGMVNKNSFHHFKIGPIFTDGLYGYRCELTLKNQECTLPDASKWEDL
jgi:hypothetical protein